MALSRKGYSVLFSLLMVYDFPMLLRLLILYSYFLIITVYTTTYSPGACRCNYTRPYGHTFISAFCGSNTHECNEAVLVYHDHSAMHTRNCCYDTHARWLKLLARLLWCCDLCNNPVPWRSDHRGPQEFVTERIHSALYRKMFWYMMTTLQITRETVATTHIPDGSNC